MKFAVRTLAPVFLLCVFASNCLALDRQAFTFTNYDLDVRIEPEQQRLGVRGKITLRNDSPTPQKIAVLQISSSLDWRSIKVADKPLQFVSQTFTSDIDHTGALSETIVTLPEAISPKGTVDLDIAYEGVIVLDGTRLTRIGTPEAAARSTDWDQISANFTAVRGVGYVAWYPIATEAVDIADGKDLFEQLGRWKARQSSSRMHLKISVPRDDGERADFLVNTPSCGLMYEQMSRSVKSTADCTYQPLGLVVPTFVVAQYVALDRGALEVHYLNGHEAAATTYADISEKAAPFVAEWFSTPHGKVTIADLADPNATAFESGALLLTPLTSADSKMAGLSAAHQITHSAFFAPRPWINEGLAHFAQALYLEHQSGRQAALDYLRLHSSSLRPAEKKQGKEISPPASEDELAQSLVNTSDEELYRGKAMCVWWMLRDMVGDQALKKALALYHSDQDKEPSYMPRLIAAQTQHDLEWFFDDWVYRDKGLPEFKIESVFPRKTLPSGYILTITVANTGAAGAEVPIIVKSAGGEILKRVEVRGKSKAVVRMQVASLPANVTVNDGSVPESEVKDNTFKVAEEARK